MTYFYIEDALRSLGIALLAARGTSKSRLCGRLLAAQDALGGRTATIIIDPGETIPNLLDKLADFSPEVQEEVTSRMIYCDFSGRGNIVPSPIYYRHSNESLEEVSQRFVQIVALGDEYQRIAPVHGQAAIKDVAGYAGMVLYASGCQLSELENLLMHTTAWEGRFLQLEKTTPELAQAIAYLRDFATWPKQQRIAHTMSTRIKAQTFTLDPTMRAIFNHSKPALNLEEIIKKKLIVLFDLSRVADIERRRYIFLHLLLWITSYLKMRGPGYHHDPLSLIIDEFSTLTNYQDEMAFQFIDEIVSVLSRSHRLWLTVVAQSLGQFNERMQRVLMSLGTQIIGQMDMESAHIIAKGFFPFDPKAVKHYHPVYFGTQDVNISLPTGPHGTFYPRIAQVIDERPEFYTLAEQEYKAARRIYELPRFNFLVRPALAEGTLSPGILPISIEDFDKDKWIDPHLVEEVKEGLRRRDGLPVGPLLAEIAQRLPKTLPTATPHATLSTHEKRRPLPPTDEEEDVS